MNWNGNQLLVILDMYLLIYLQLYGKMPLKSLSKDMDGQKNSTQAS